MRGRDVRRRSGRRAAPGRAVRGTAVGRGGQHPRGHLPGRPGRGGVPGEAVGPGLPAPFWQVWEELQRIGVPAASVTAVHSELEPCRLPGCYCDPLLRRFGFPGAEISFGQPYGTTPGERAAAVAAVADRAAALAKLVGQPVPPRARPVPPPAGEPAAPPVDGARLGQVLAATFGHDQVQRYHPDELARAGVLQGQELTLVSAGLPARIPYLFQAWSVVPVPERLRARGSPLPPEALGRLDSLVTLGGDGHCVIGMLVSGPPHLLGGLWAVDPDLGTTRFVSSGAAVFARMLAVLTRGRQRMRGLDPYAAGEVVERLQGQLASIDPPAFHGEDNWWPLLVEQMWNGLL
ncbi:hypothetical protein GEV43_28380 [Actinomadura sp. J1-007]|nr:hypothetical protein [Actinomadura sp. J1-007]